MRRSFFAPGLLLLLLVVVPCFKAEEIRSLPGLSFTPSFRHYSGFLRASDTHFLHYWFVESQRDPVKDPLIFWFNGGPGCSSLDGLLNEMGPYVVNEDGKTLRQNPNAWNRFASVVYIEAPAGVGYSYSTDGNTTTNDDQTSAENYEALKQFFTTFPEFRNRSTYIIGESYGGVYVPTLAARVIDGQKDFPINFKGLALGNGYVHEKLNLDTSIRFAYAHGLVDEKVWNTLEHNCCGGCIDGCDLSALTDHCSDLAQDIFNFMWGGGLNIYDLYRDCEANPLMNGARARAFLKGVGPMSQLAKTETQQPTAAVPKRKKTLLDLVRKTKMLYGDAPCLNDTAVLHYMNDAKVREALNVPTNLGQWEICSDKIGDTYQKQYGDMSPFIKKALDAHVRVLLYYGDTDMACNFMMGQQFADRLGLRRQLGKTPWKFDKQIAGFKTLFDGLTYLTIRGAGHMAPQWRAPQMAYVIEQFLLNQPI